MKFILTFLLISIFAHAQEDLLTVYDSDEILKKGIELFEKQEYEKSIFIFGSIFFNN